MKRKELIRFIIETQTSFHGQNDADDDIMQLSLTKMLQINELRKDEEKRSKDSNPF